MLHTVCETTQYLRETIQYLRNDTVFSRNDLRNETVFARETIARNDTVFAKRHSIFEKLLRNDTVFARNDLRNDTVVASERYCICLRERHRICERAILYLREKPFLRYRSYRCLPRQFCIHAPQEYFHPVYSQPTALGGCGPLDEAPPLLSPACPGRWCRRGRKHQTVGDSRQRDQTPLTSLRYTRQSRLAGLGVYNTFWQTDISTHREKDSQTIHIDRLSQTDSKTDRQEDNYCYPKAQFKSYDDES